MNVDEFLVGLTEAYDEMDYEDEYGPDYFDENGMGVYVYDVIKRINKERKKPRVAIKPLFKLNRWRVFFNVVGDGDRVEEFWSCPEELVSFVDRLGKKIQYDNEGHLFYYDNKGIRRYDVRKDEDDSLNNFAGYDRNGRRFYYSGTKVHFRDRNMKPYGYGKVEL